MKKLSTHPQSSSAMNSEAGVSNRMSKFAVACMLLAITMSVGKISAQLSGTITVPSSGYPTLQNAFDSLNIQGVSGAVTINVTAGNPQYPSASTNGYVLGSSTLNSSISSSKTITFNGNGNIINAYSGSRTQTNTSYVGSGTTDALITLRGTDYVTINNFQFRDTSTNTTQATAMECGVAMYNFSGTSGAMDGCQYVNVTNCTFNFQNFNTNGYCVWIAPFINNSTTQLNWTAYSDRHAHINVNNNVMTEGWAFGFARGTGQDMRARDINFTNNTVNNAGGPNAFMYGALGYYYVDTVNMTGNTVTMDNTYNQSTAYILFPYYCGGDYRVRNNTINYVKGSTAYSSYGIYAYCYNYGSEATVSDFRISGNNFNYPQSGSVTSTTANTYYNIYHYNYVYNSSAGTLLRGTSYLDSNTIENDTIQGSGTFYHIQSFGSSQVGPFKLFMRGNRINNVLRNGMGGTNYIYQTYGWGDTVDIGFNLFNNFRYNESTTSTTVAPTIYIGYSYHTSAAGKPVFIHDNTWSNIGCRLNTTGSPTMYLCYTYGPSIQFYNNKMHNNYIGSYSSGGGNIYGLFLASTTDNLRVYSNVIDSMHIYNSGTANGSGALFPIYHGSNGTNVSMYNNYIGELYSRNVSNGNAINGIYIASSPNITLANNTIQFGRNGAISSNGSTFGGSGVYYTSSGTLVMRNNIINIKGTPASSTFIAVRRNTGSSGTKPNNFSASNNIYYVNQNANNYLYGEGTGTSPVNAFYNLGSSGSNTTGTFDGSFNGACGLYKIFMKDEASTFTEDVLNTNGSVANTTVPSGTTYAKSSALSLTNPPISPDLAGATRATFPDRGALEFSGTAVDGSGPVISFNSLPDLYCTSTGASLTATITDPSGVNTTSGTKPRLYYRRSTNTDAYGANNSSVNGWKYVEASNSTSPFTFNIDYSLLNGSAVAVGDKFYYYVVAQDNASTANVSMVRGSLLPAGTCPTSVNIGGTSGLSGTSIGDSFSVTTAPSFSVVKSPTTTVCFKDTVSHLVILSAASASFPSYTTSLSTNGRPSQNTYWDIDSIQINGAVNATTCSNASASSTAANSLPASVANIYSNFTNLGNFVDLTAGTTATWRLVMNNSIGNSYQLAYSIYIDFNRNGTFELPAETVATSPAAITMTSSSTSCGPYPAWTGTFAVPSNVSSGPTLMRVMGSYSTVITSPTVNYSYGETEDYIVNLLGVPNGANHAWTSNKTAATILGTTNPLRHASAADTTIYRDSMNIAGCPVSAYDTLITGPRLKMLGATNSTQCGGGIPAMSVSDSNGFSSPVINWFATATSTTPLQSATNTTFLSPVTATTTLWVAVQSPSTGCWSERRSITVTVNPADTFNVRANGILDTIRVCSGKAVALTITNISNIGQAGGAFNSFNWSCSNANSGLTTTTNSTGTTTITPTSGGEYILTATASNGATASACRNVKFYKLSVQGNPFTAGAAFITAIPNPVCIGSAVTHTLYLAAPNATFPTYTSLGTNGRPSQTQYWDIDSFQLNNYVNVTNCAGGGSATAVNTLPASVTNVYSNFTNLGIIETLLGGKPASWKIVMNNSIGNSYPLAYAIYVDYNRNGTFELPAEQAVYLPTAVNMTSASASCGPYPAWSGTFNVPATVVSGPTLMRVMGSYSQTLTSATINYSYGETEDYMVNLVGPADTNVSKLAWQSSATGATVLGTDKVLVHNLPAASTIYKVTMSNGVCTDTAKDTVTNNTAALATSTINGPTSACAGETLLLSTVTTGGCIPYSYNWSSTGGTITAIGASTNNDSVIFTPTGSSGSKTVNLTVTGNNGVTVTQSLTISFNNPVPTVTGATICGTKTATISATASVSTDVINWYANPNTFVPLASNTTTFTTPVLNAQTIYWVRQFTSLIDSCEPKLAYYATIISTAYGDEVQATKRVIMLSTDVYATASGASTSAPVTGQIDISLINVSDGSEITSTGMTNITITSTPGSTTISPSRVNLGWKVDPGTYRVMLKNYSSNVSGMEYRYQTGIQPSATTSGAFKVTNGWIGANYDYYNMYFWNFQIDEGCFGAPVPDTVKYISPPALTISRARDSICSGSCTAPVTLTSTASNFSTYTWTGSTNWSGNATTGWVNCEPTVGSYTMTITGTNTTGLQCANKDTINIKVKSIPSPITKYPASGILGRCNSVIDSLDAFSESQVTVKVGTGTGYLTGGANYNYPSPFPNYWYNSWQQYLYTASELTAAGIKPGVINAAAFRNNTLPSPNTNSYNDYRMFIGATSVTSLSSWLDSSSMVMVFPTATMPSTSVTSTANPTDVPFTNTFTWNGSSNIVVDIRLTEDYGNENSNPEVTNTSFTSVNYFYNTSSPSGGTWWNTGQTRYTTTSRPNIYLTQTIRDTIKWSPLTNLYTNSGATTAYTGNWRESVFARPNDTIKYYANAISKNGCVIKDSVLINVTDTVTFVQQPATYGSYCIGDTVRLIAKASSTSPMTRVWRKGGTPISVGVNPTANKDTLVIVITTLSDSGNYSIQYTTGAPCGPKVSNTSVVKVRTNVVITTQPTAKTICVGSGFTLTAGATSDSARNWVQIGGSGTNTGTTNTFTRATTTFADSGMYFLRYKSFVPCRDISTDTVRVAILPPAQISSQPVASTTLCIGQNTTLSPGVTGGVQGYQWLKNGTPIAGPSGTQPTYTVTASSTADAGTYRLVVFSPTGCNNDTSSASAGVITVNLPVSITAHPTAKTDVCEGSTFTASVTAANTSGYEWFKNGVTLGVTTNPYVLNNTQMTDAGIYTVKVKGLASCADVMSNGDTMSVIPLAKITSSPTATTVCENQTLTLNAAGSNTVGYQWLKNGVPNGVSSNPLVITNAQMSDSATYCVIAVSAKGCKTDTSTCVVGAVLRKVVINTQPIPTDLACVGKPYSIVVNASNVSGYAWFKNSTAVSPAVNSNTLTKNPFSITDTGSYYVAISGNGPCPVVNSNLSKITATYAANITTEPAATLDVCIGSTLSLSVASINTSSYQWFKNGAAISGQTASTLNLGGTTAASAGTYSVVAYGFNGCTNDTSANSVVTMKTPLSFTANLPASQNLCEGNGINLSVSVSGSGPLAYTWTQNGTTLSSTSNAYSKSNIVSADAGKYIVNVSGSPVCAAIKDSSSITVNKAPVMTVQPNGASPICLGSSFSMNAAAANSSGLDWYKSNGSGGTLVQANSNTYGNATSILTDAGSYYVVAKPLPACTQTTSSMFTLNINTPATISTDPIGASLLTDPAGSWTMTVGVTGTGPFTYQWRKNGVNMTGATGASYTIASYVEATHQGDYDCIIKSGAPCNSIDTSAKAKIVTTKCPVINTQPISRVDICAGASFSLDVTAVGVKSYQWFRDGQAIPGAINSNFSILSAKTSDAGLYEVEAIAFNTSICPRTFSDSVRVVVKSKPAITSQPMPSLSCGATTHTMKVVAEFGDTYQWYKNGNAISPNGSSSSYTYTSVNTIGDNFYVEIGNNLCPSAVSNTVNVKSINPANKVKLATKSIFDLVERCTDNNGWTYYAPTAQSDELYLAIKRGDTQVNTARPDIEITKGIREISPINAEQRGVILGSRIFNLDFASTIKTPYEVKFYYSKLEEDAVMSRWRDIRNAAGSLFSTNRTDTLTFITSTQQPFTSTLWSNVTVPLNFTNTIAHTDRVFGVENGIRYVIIKRLIATRGGGSMFMDYNLGNGSSAISNINSNGFGFNVYPVPSTDGKVIVEVTSKRMKPLNFIISDMAGRVIANFEEKHAANNSEHQFDFSNLANGNYQIQVANDQESMIGKFTISK